MDESMIARQDAYIEKTDVWAKLSAPVPSGVISWRQDGKVTARDGKYFARFVAYIEANTVRERLDAVVPGEWDLTLDLMPAVSAEDGDGAQCSFKARLQILGVIREDIGTGRDYKSASTDAFKRAAVRFGIAHELYAYEQNWVEMDGDGKYPKPLEDPQVAYARRYAPSSSLTDMDVVSCPKCGGRMWDNRLTKRNPRAPDYKCQSRSCDGVVWPAKTAATLPAEGEEEQGGGKSSALVGAEEEELPF
jgi:hypothetical protein